MTELWFSAFNGSRLQRKRHEQTFYIARNPFVHCSISQIQILVANSKIYRLRLGFEIALYFHLTARAAAC